MKRNVFDDNIDFKSLIGKFIAKWYYFVITMVVALALAYFYLQVANRTYEVEATVQLNENTYNYGEKESLTVLADLMKKQTVVEDEIGMMASYEIVGRAIRQLDFTVSYYQQGTFMGFDNPEEVYNCGFAVLPDTQAPQPVYLPVHIVFLENDRVKISAEGEDVKLYDLSTKTTLPTPVPQITYEKVQSVFAPVRSKYLNFEIILDSTASFEPGSEYFFVINKEEDLIDKYREKLEISRLSEESNIMHLLTSGSVVEKEKRFLNTLMQTFIDHDLQKKNQFGMKAIEFIDKQIDKVSDSLQNVEGVLQDFRSDNNIIDIGITSENLSQRLKDLEAQRAELSIKNEFYKDVSRSISKGSDVNNVIAPSSAGIQDPLLQKLLVELSTLQQQKISVEYSSAKNNPVLKVLNQKIENTKASLQENIDNLIKSNQIALNQVDREMRGLRSELSEVPANERNLIDLQRKFTHSDNVYNFLLQKRAEAGIAVASNVPDKSIVDEARMLGDKPASPNVVKVLVLAVLASFLFPIGFVMAEDFFSDKIHSKEDLQNLTNIPILESIARAEYTKDRVKSVKNKLVLEESFKFTRANLQYIYGNNTCKVIGVTSSVEGEGKTFCSAHLSMSFARSGKKTLLICGDLHRPRIKEYFRITNKLGVADFLSHKASLEEVIQHTDVHDLDLIPPGNVRLDPSSLLELPQMQELFEWARANYTYVVVETPPVGYVADYLLMMKNFDINLLVVRHNYTEKKMLLSTEDLLVEKKVSNLNILFNGVKPKSGTQYKYREKLTKYRKSEKWYQG